MLLKETMYKYVVLHNKDYLCVFANLQKTYTCKTQDVYNAIDGFVNVMHLREINRKRIDGPCCDIATDKCFNNIIRL